MRVMKLLVLAAIVVMVVACGGAAGGVATPAGDPATEVPASTAATAGGTGGESPTAAAEAGGTQGEIATGEPTTDITTEEDLTVEDLSVGLADLQSYRSQLILHFAGKDETGVEVTSDLDTREEFTKEPLAQRYSSISTGATGGVPDPQTSFEMITVGDTAYMVSQDASGASSCVTVQSDETTAQPSLTPDMWGGISGYRYVNTETANGVNAKHYAWNEASGLPVTGYGTTRGETWVAVDGGYVVRYVAEVTGQGALFSTKATEGMFTVEYNLTDVNAAFVIEPPEGCQGPASDIPILPDARDKTSFGDLISYQTSTAPGDVASFYREEMPKNGWQPSGTPTEMGDLYMLEFQKDNRTAQVTITLDTSSNVVSVMISISQ